jgi:two-component system, NarL family, nitrate/nitrite response regulator NarL
VIRVEVELADGAMRRELEELMASSPGLSLASEDPDVLLASAPLDGLPAGAPIVLLGEPSWSPEALRLGVRAMLRPDAPSNEIVAAVYAAAGGLAAVDPRDLEGWLGGASAAPVAEAGPLTPREREVLILLAEGAANKTIAWKLDISEHTAKFHVASILAKLNAGTRAEAVAQGIKRGLLLL